MTHRDRLARVDISIHALREEGDFFSVVLHPAQSDFYPRPPRGGRPVCGEQGGIPEDISIHALREEGDAWRGPLHGGNIRFLSTPSARRATFAKLTAKKERLAISIHALREEGDTSPRRRGPAASYFYPRPPRGGRQQKQRQNLYFQTNYTTFCTNLEEP